MHLHFMMIGRGPIIHRPLTGQIQVEGWPFVTTPLAIGLGLHLMLQSAGVPYFLGPLAGSLNVFSKSALNAIET